MKKQFFAVALAAGALMTSCQEVSSPVGEMGTTSFSVSVEDAVSSRADGAELTYTMEVYDAAKANVLFEDTNTDGVFEVELMDGQTYVAAFWANATADVATYNTENLKAVALNADKTAAEAWAGTKEFTVVNDGANSETVTLTRTVAKLTLIETANIPANSNLQVAFSEPNLYNVIDGAASGTQNYSQKFSVNEGNAVADTDKDFQIATDIFVLCSGATSEITFSMFEGEATESFSNITASSVPMAANRNTNITGHYITNSNFSLNVTCSDTWETESDNQLESLPQGATIPQE